MVGELERARGDPMKRQGFISLFFCIFTSFLLMLTGCSRSIVKMPKPLPSIVKKYKHITLPGDSPGMRNTRVYMNENDPYTILATGSINTWPKGPTHHDVRPEHGWPLMARIGKKNWYFEPCHHRNAFTSDSPYSGYLYLGVRDGNVDRYGNPSNPEFYGDNIGSFSVDIIVWQRDDYVQIADLLEKMKEKDPTNRAIVYAANDATYKKNLFLASSKASKEIEETKKEIQELKEESQREKGTIAKSVEEKKPPLGVKPAIAELNKDQKIAQLHAKLSELTENLKQLEEMKRQLEEERKKTTLLSKELSEKEMREKDLLGQLEKAEKGPPVVVIASPKDGIEVEVGTITFSGVAEDDQGLKGLDFFINNNPLLTKFTKELKASEKAHPKRLEFSERVLLQKGKNEIRIRATDTDGLVAEKILTVRYRELRKNVWAVVIGIDQYQKTRHLKYAVNDARDFYNHLIRNNRIPKENITLLINQEAQCARLRSMLGTHLKNKAGREDMVIIYFAGHGACEKDVMSPDGDGLEKYILPCDADPKDLYGSALPMSEVSRIFNRIRSDRLIFIADACYSGASGGRTISLSGVRANISDAFLDRIATGKGRIILTASGANEVSGEDDKLEHGVFTYFLLEALRGKADTDGDGIITVDEAYRYVSREVPRATGQEQHPVKKGIVEGQLILGVIE
jgi:hypothetical protein